MKDAAGEAIAGGPSAARPPGSPVLRLQGVHKRLGGRPVLDGLDLDVAAGEVVGLLGPNGSGKSTAIHLACGLLGPDAGAVTVEGRPAGRATAERIGLCPQEVALYRDLDAAENLDFFGCVYGVPAALRRRRVAELVRRFDLAPWLKRPVSSLSGGWQRRVNIAAALVHAPPLLLLDEPTAALDVAARHALWDVLASLAREGLALLLSTHHLEEAERLCTRVGLLHGGRIVREGRVADLLAEVPGRLMATVAGADPVALHARAAQLGWAVRVRGGVTSCLLPDLMSLREVVEALDGLAVTAVTLQPVTLEHAYLEILDRVAGRTNGGDAPDDGRGGPAGP